MTEVIAFTNCPAADVRQTSFLVDEYLQTFEEPSGLNLLGSEATVTAAYNPDGSTDYALQFAHEPLAYQQFYSLLAETAPYKPDQTPLAVLQDWNLLVIEERERDATTRKNDAEYGTWLTRVLEYHKKFGASWTDFTEGSLDLFRGLMDDFYDDHYTHFPVHNANGEVLKYISPERIYNGFFPVDDIDRRWASEYFTRQHKPKTVAHLVEDFEHVGIMLTETDVVESLRVCMSRSRAMRKSPRSGARAAKHIFENTTPAKRREYTAAVIKRLPEELQAVLRGWIIDRSIDTFEGEDGVAYGYLPTEANQPLSEVMKGMQITSHETRVAKVVPITYGDGKNTWSVLPGSVRRTASLARLSPEIAWRTLSDGVRTLRLGHEAIDADERTHRDRMLGFITLGYLQPEVRANWATTWKNPDPNRPPQGMGVAQLPLYVLLPKIKEQLLVSPLLDVAELAIAYTE